MTARPFLISRTPATGPIAPAVQAAPVAIPAPAALPLAPETLVDVLTAQRNCYTELAALARQQSEHVTTGDTEGLMTVLAARSRLIEQLAPLDEKLGPCKSRWQEVLDGLPEAPRAVVAGLLKEVQQLLGQILEQDERDRASLAQQKESVSAELGRTVSGTQVNRAYGIRPRGQTSGFGAG